MSDASRKRMPLPLDDDDRATIERTARRGGLKGEAVVEPDTQAKPEQEPTAAARPEKSPQKGRGAVAKGQDMPDPAALFRRNDLRPQIAYDSDLARAVAEVFSDLDPAAQRFVKPSTMLKNFLTENDAALAKLFRQSSSRPG